MKQYQETVTAYTAEHGLFRAVLGTAVVASSLVLGVVVATQGYRTAFDGKALYGVSMNGVSYGGVAQAELHDRLSVQAEHIEQLPLHVESSTASTTLKALGIHLDTAKATQDVMNVGRTGDFIDQVWTTLAVLVTPEPVRWHFVASETTTSSLEALVAGATYASTDAAFTIDNGSLVITPEKQGVVIDVPTTLARLETTYLRGIPTSLRVALAPSIPVVGAADLESMVPAIRLSLDRAVSVTTAGATGTASKSDMLAWINLPESSEGAISYNEAAIAAWIDSATAKSERAAVDRQVLASGSVVSEGQVGRAVDAVGTARQVYAALQASTTASVVVPALIVTTEPATKVVAAETTAGLYPGKYVEVDLSSQQLYQYEGDQLIASYRISSGKASTPTPVGTYSIQDKAPRAWSARFGLYLPYWMPFIGSTYGLHALPEWPGGYREGENHLGRAVSHGCVRLGTASAATVYEWIEVGTPVVIHR